MALHMPRFSYDDLAQLPNDGKRYELADGELIVSPAPTYDHQRIVWQFSRLLMRAEDAGYGQGVVSPIDVVFGRYATT
jgi:Uma2 family endonuclease